MTPAGTPRARRRWSFRSRPLRSRLAVLVASAVAVAVAAVALSAWLITREALTDRLDDSLQASNRGVVRYVEYWINTNGCQSNGPNPPGPFVSGQSASIQAVLSDGSSCMVSGNLFKPGASDKAVAAGQSRDSYHDAVDSTGTPIRVYTRSTTLVTADHRTIAISVSAPLSQVTVPLERLALVLAVVAGIGVLGATSAGLVVARAGLRPVDRLTEAVEHVARTEDLAIRIPVEGEDEIARLSAAFNSMTAGLASSRERQQQLIADAGHELRTPLTSLRTNIELLARSEQTGRPIPPDDRRALLSSVKAQMTELAALIGDLQELSRPDAAPDSEPGAVRRRARRRRTGRRPRPVARSGHHDPLAAVALVRPGRTGLPGTRAGQPAGQRGEVQPGRRHDRRAAGERRVQRARPRPRHPGRRPAARLRTLLALAVRPQPARLRAGAVHRGPHRAAGRRLGRRAPGVRRRHGGRPVAARRADRSAGVTGAAGRGGDINCRP